jgi:hypothetical protein
VQELINVTGEDDLIAGWGVTLPRALRAAERAGRSEAAARYYAALQDVLRRTAAGETLEAIDRELHPGDYALMKGGAAGEQDAELLDPADERDKPLTYAVSDNFTIHDKGRFDFTEAQIKALADELIASRQDAEDGRTVILLLTMLEAVAKLDDPNHRDEFVMYVRRQLIKEVPEAEAALNRLVMESAARLKAEGAPK